MKSIKLLILPFLVCLFMASCSGFRYNESYKVVWPNETWERSTPEAQGIDSAELLDAIEAMKLKNPGVNSMVIIKNGYIIAEFYREPFNSDTAFKVNSCAKSFTSALVGIAIDEKLIKNVNQPILPYFDEIDYADPKVAEITIKDLLTMRSGFDWKEQIPERLEGFGNDGRIFQHLDDMISYIFSKPIVSKPGSDFNYNSMNSQLLADIVHRVTGYQSNILAKEKLFDPIGIDTWGWLKSPEGSIKGGTSLNMSTEDLARFGYLYLNEGMWDGKSIISKSWVRNSVRRYTTTETEYPDEIINPIPYYGYQWWIWNENIYMAYGGSGQVCYINQETGIVVALNSESEASQQAFVLRSLLSQFSRLNISKSPLKENIDSLSMLKNYLNMSGKAPEVSYEDMDLLISKLNEKEILLDENEFDWKSMKFQFRNDFVELYNNDLIVIYSNIGDDYYSYTSLIPAKDFHFGEKTFNHYSRITGFTSDSMDIEIINSGYGKSWITLTVKITGNDVVLTRHLQTYGNRDREEKILEIHGHFSE